MRYTFGNTITAAERLKVIAEFFNPLACKMIKQYVNDIYDTVIDLGCGPGYTTNMLYNTIKCNTVYGFDNSEEFIEIARSGYERFHFKKHDITKIPFPVKGDFMYARFLLSHLKNIKNVIKGWTDQLNPGGILFIDELYDIYTDKKIFTDYIKVNANLIKSQGADLFIGKKLNEAVDGLYIIHNEVTKIPVYNYQAAQWFYPNTISIWNTDEYILKTISEEKRKGISEKICEMRFDNSGKSNITWYMKRIFIKKR